MNFNRLIMCAAILSGACVVPTKFVKNIKPFLGLLRLRNPTMRLPYPHRGDIGCYQKENPPPQAYLPLIKSQLLLPATSYSWEKSCPGFMWFSRDDLIDLALEREAEIPNSISLARKSRSSGIWLRSTDPLILVDYVDTFLRCTWCAQKIKDCSIDHTCKVSHDLDALEISRYPGAKVLWSKRNGAFWGWGCPDCDMFCHLCICKIPGFWQPQSFDQAIEEANSKASTS